MDKTLMQTIDQPPPPSPLSVECPECRSLPGQRCRNWKGKGCATHRRRRDAVAPVLFDAAADQVQANDETEDDDGAE